VATPPGAVSTPPSEHVPCAARTESTAPSAASPITAMAASAPIVNLAGALLAWAVTSAAV
jgi:hypothetical protein